MTPLRLGCIADDFTGATDLANNLVRAGMRTVVTNGVPEDETTIDADAIVVALKTRTIPAHEAVSMSLHACRALRARDAKQIYFKICSTFDSTPSGNIGPVIEALMDELHCDFSIIASAFPDNGRTIYQGYLFIHQVLLSESSMRHHPLTPMTDSNLLRMLTAQLSIERHHKVGLLPQQIVSSSEDQIRHEMSSLLAEGVTIAIADTVTWEDMDHLAAALHNAPLVTASSGLAACLPSRWGYSPSAKAMRLPPAHGRSAILAGSCSDATNRQVQHFLKNGGHGWQLDPLDLVKNRSDTLVRALRWTEEQWQINTGQTLLIYSSIDSQHVATVRKRFGADEIGSLVERWMGEVAIALVQRNVRRLVIAGGETSGVCTQALEIPWLRIGPQIDPGVPWCYADVARDAPGGLHLTLKSGNFGSDDFFCKSLSLLDTQCQD